MKDPRNLFIFNQMKHHTAFIKRQIAEVTSRQKTMAELARDTLRIGDALMDLYHGCHSDEMIFDEIFHLLDRQGLTELEAFRRHVQKNDGYFVETISDGSRWVLRYAEEGEAYLHLHPGRHSPLTMRVRANVLKTAVLAVAYAGMHRLPVTIQTVNLVRKRYTNLDRPTECVKSFGDSPSIRTFIELLGGKL